MVFGFARGPFWFRAAVGEGVGVGGSELDGGRACPKISNGSQTPQLQICIVLVFGTGFILNRVGLWDLISRDVKAPGLTSSTPL